MTGASFQHRSPHGCLLSRSWSHDDHLLFTERSHSSAAVVARAVCAKTAFGKYTGDFQSHKVQFRNLLPLKANKFGAFSLCSAFENLHRQYLHFFQWLQKKKKKIQGDVTSSFLWLSPWASEWEPLFYHWCHGKMEYDSEQVRTEDALLTLPAGGREHRAAGKLTLLILAPHL